MEKNTGRVEAEVIILNIVFNVIDKVLWLELADVE